MIKPARSFRVINESLAQSLARDFGIRTGQLRTSATRFGISRILSAEYRTSVSVKGPEATDPVVLDRIVKKLSRAGQLRARPDDHYEFLRRDRGWYVAERMSATPVYLPLRDVPPGEPDSPRALNVWVCPPDLSITHPDPAGLRVPGSVVFLVEELRDFVWPVGSAVSGLSSLRLLVDVVSARRALSWEGIMALAGSDDRFSERRRMGPLAKLKEVGGLVGVERRIEAVYKVAYMNDEQCFFYEKRFMRVNDILAYPLYIVVE